MSDLHLTLLAEIEACPTQRSVATLAGSLGRRLLLTPELQARLIERANFLAAEASAP
jgi:hypothetical protein